MDFTEGSTGLEIAPPETGLQLSIPGYIKLILHVMTKKYGVFVTLLVIGIIVFGFLFGRLEEIIYDFTGKEDEPGTLVEIFFMMAILFIPFSNEFYKVYIKKEKEDKSHLKVWGLGVVGWGLLILLWRYVEHERILYFFRMLCLPWWVIIISLVVGIIIGYKMRSHHVG